MQHIDRFYSQTIDREGSIINHVKIERGSPGIKGCIFAEKIIEASTQIFGNILTHIYRHLMFADYRTEILQASDMIEMGMSD